MTLFVGVQLAGGAALRRGRQSLSVAPTASCRTELQDGEVGLRRARGASEQQQGRKAGRKD